MFVVGGVNDEGHHLCVLLSVRLQETTFYFYSCILFLLSGCVRFVTLLHTYIHNKTIDGAFVPVNEHEHVSWAVCEESGYGSRWDRWYGHDADLVAVRAYTYACVYGDHQILMVAWVGCVLSFLQKKIKKSIVHLMMMTPISSA